MFHQLHPQPSFYWNYFWFLWNSRIPEMRTQMCVLMLLSNFAKFCFRQVDLKWIVRQVNFAHQLNSVQTSLGTLKQEDLLLEHNFILNQFLVWANVHRSNAEAVPKPILKKYIWLVVVNNALRCYISKDNAIACPRSSSSSFSFSFSSEKAMASLNSSSSLFSSLLPMRQEAA